MTKFEEEVMATAKMIPTLDGNELQFKTSSALYDLLLINGEAELYLHKQALPVVPEFIGELINTFGAPEDGKHINYTASYPENKKELDWIDNHQKTWLTALLFGFTVEKPQLFYLKHIDFCKTDKHYDWFTIKHSDGPLNHLRVEKGEKPSTIDCKFTQQEIDSMQTGSYEKIEVHMEDGE
ncbi:MAG: DUF1642 domain-containing protein [Lactococcus lactis]